MRLTLLSQTLSLAIALAGAAAGAALAAPETQPAKAAAGHYELDPRHTSVHASVLHAGLSHFTMRIRQVSGGYDFDPAHPEATKITVNLDAASLDAGDPSVGKQFAKEFLDADDHPQITFVSTSIEPGAGLVKGDLTFRGVTRPVILNVAYNGYESGLIGGRRMGFSGSTTIVRSQFGSRAWLSQVGDEVKVTIEAEFQRK